jgi:hypothetical protein
MAMYSFVPPFCEAKFGGVPACIFDKVGCAAGENIFWNAGIYYQTPKHFAHINLVGLCYVASSVVHSVLEQVGDLINFIHVVDEVSHLTYK